MTTNNENGKICEYGSIYCRLRNTNFPAEIAKRMVDAVRNDEVVE